jgi:hypothetical protein
MNCLLKEWLWQQHEVMIWRGQLLGPRLLVGTNMTVAVLTRTTELLLSTTAERNDRPRTGGNASVLPSVRDVVKPVLTFILSSS